MIGYPPLPIYPYGIDSNYTLFLVYNTTESILAQDNDPWSEEVVIVPRTNTQLEVWSNNGFANINGELLYYDDVDKDINGRVYKLKRCARNLSGNPTKFNPAGSMVRGFVVAEHHNQLVEGIILTEQFIGSISTTDQSTLDWRIRNLQAVPIIFDDFGCPDVVFHYTVVSSDPSAGTTINYSFDIKGSYNQFTLSFGDGSSTSSVQSGSHTYAPNANIDPIITFSNDNCRVVQTPIQRDNVNAPESRIPDVIFQIPNSPNFAFPVINVNIPSFPEPNLGLPPFQFPCIDLAPFNIGPIQIPSIIMVEPPIPVLPSIIDFGTVHIPSFIGIGGLNLPSIVAITGPNLPSVIVLTQPNFPTNISINVPSFPSISFNASTLPSISINVPTFPSISINSPTFPAINVNVPTFPAININVPTFPAISVSWGSAPTVAVGWTPVPLVPITWGVAPNVQVNWSTPPSISMNWGTPPTVNVNWGTPPTINVNVTVACPSVPLALAATDHVGMNNDMLGIGRDLEIEYDVSGFPSEIKVIPPEIPDVRVIHDVPSEIVVKMPTFPNFKVDVPEFRDIRILPPDTQLTIEAIGIPDVIKLVPTSPIPERIELWMPVNIPDVIRLEHDIPDVIRIEGLPEFIRLEHDLPSTIKLEMPDKPEIELVYKGSPIPVQVQLDIQKLIGDENYPCVALVPCKNLAK